MRTSRISRYLRPMANLCQHCGQTGHLVPECCAYSLRISTHPRKATLPSQRYAHDPGCLSLNEAVNFVSLLSTIRRHLYTSTNTQQYYVSIAQEFQSKLEENGYRVYHQPCLDDFRSFVVDHWPTFRSIEESTEKVLWGRVSKQAESPHEVGILSSLISAAEVANSRPGPGSNLLPLPLYNLILTVVILHELSHAYTKYLFNNIIIPEGVDPTHGRYGESGWLLETRLMQGSVSASWDHESDVGQMKLIKRVVLETAGSAYIIDVDAAKNILQSLGSSHLTPPSTYSLVESLGNDFRARVTETTSLPKREVVYPLAPVGLGFCSYLGSDRWEAP